MGGVVAGVGVQVVLQRVRQLLDLCPSYCATQLIYIVSGAEGGDLNALRTLEEP